MISGVKRPHDVHRRSCLGNNAAAAGGGASLCLELGGDSLSLGGGERVVNGGIEGGEEVHCNKACCRGRGVRRVCFKG